jgi:hypothetical protein
MEERKIKTLPTQRNTKIEHIVLEATSISFLR